MHKCTVILLVTCLLVSSLIAFTFSSATVQAVSKLSIPQFTVKFVNNFYDVPPSSTTVTDPYTGKENTITSPGNHVDRWNIEVMVKNQPFTSYTDADGYEHNLRYRVEFKGHFEDDQGWKLFTSYVQSGAQYTTITLDEYGVWNLGINSLSAGSQLDFRVKAEIEYYGASRFDMGLYTPRERIVEVSSGWSGVQTITKSDETTSLSSPSQTTTLPPITSDGNGQPQSPGQMQPPNSIFTNPLFTLGVGVLLGGAVIAVVLVVLRRHIKTPNYTDNSLHQTSGVKR